MDLLFHLRDNGLRIQWHCCIVTMDLVTMLCLLPELPEHVWPHPADAVTLQLLGCVHPRLRTTGVASGPGHWVSTQIPSCPIPPGPPPLLFGPLGILMSPTIFNGFASDNVILSDIALINCFHTSLNSVSKFLCIFDRPIYPCCSSSLCSQWHSTGGEFSLLFTVCAFKQ